MSEFTIKDNSSKPYAHMLEGVNLNDINSAEQYVRDYAAAGINATNYGEYTDSEIMETWLESGELEEAADYIQSRIDEEIGVLYQVMTTAEVSEEFGVSDAAVRMSIQRGSITARQSGSTWLVKRSDAEKRWKKS